MCVQSPWEKALEFHGHVCPGLVIGFRAAEAGLRELGLDPAGAQGADLVCVVENRACAADAVQAVTGCTLGKANLVVADHGKHVYTFARREAGGEAVRVSLTAPVPELEELHAMQEKAFNEPGEENRRAFARKREDISDRLMEMPESELFQVRRVRMEPPVRQRVKCLALCGRCGEYVFEDRAADQGGRVLCPPCAAE
ncbi:MAG: FmdE family protein [Bacillota bacterium]